MKKSFSHTAIHIPLVILLSLLSSDLVSGQTTRFFRFVGCNDSQHDWRDSSFVAATSDPTVINEVLAELALPMANRSKFPTGTIIAGNGGYNCNGTHCFSWRFDSTAWSLTDFAIEVCDGCPYSDLDMNLPYWIDTLGSYCPWGGRVIEELPLLSVPEEEWLKQVKVSPNPSAGHLEIAFPKAQIGFRVEVFDLQGKSLWRLDKARGSVSLDLPPSANGMVLVYLSKGEHMLTRKIILASRN